MNKRVFISTNYAKIWSLINFDDKDRANNDMGLSVFQNTQYSVLLFDEDKKSWCFKEYDSKNHKNADIFFIDIKAQSLPNGITINGENDYLLYHLGASETDNSITNSSIIVKFNNKAGGHHESSSGDPNPEWYRYQWTIDIILDDSIPNKAEAIIKKVFDDTNIRIESQNLLTSYLRKKPEGECPQVFKGVEEAYNALRDCKDKVKGKKYTQCLEQLRDIFGKDYYSDKKQ